MYTWVKYRYDTTWEKAAQSDTVTETFSGVGLKYSYDYFLEGRLDLSEQFYIFNLKLAFLYLWLYL